MIDRKLSVLSSFTLEQKDSVQISKLFQKGKTLTGISELLKCLGEMLKNKEIRCFSDEDLANLTDALTGE